jgi:hypothetical protein
MSLCFCLIFLCTFLKVGKPDGRRTLGRPRRRLVDNIKMDRREIGWDGVDWINMAQDREQWKGSCEYGIKHSGFMKCWEGLEWLPN